MLLNKESSSYQASDPLHPPQSTPLPPPKPGVSLGFRAYRGFGPQKSLDWNIFFGGRRHGRPMFFSGGLVFGRLVDFFGSLLCLFEASRPFPKSFRKPPVYGWPPGVFYAALDLLGCLRAFGGVCVIERSVPSRFLLFNKNSWPLRPQ